MEKERLYFLQIHSKDNVLVALQDLQAGQVIDFAGQTVVLVDHIKAKHKFTLADYDKDQEIYMYGVLVGKLNYALPKGSLITVDNLRHASEDFKLGERKLEWHKPDVSKYQNKTFFGFHRSNGKVGTANYWLVIPLVFCENRNVLTLKSALEERLGYKVESKDYSNEVDLLLDRYKAGASIDELLQMDLTSSSIKQKTNRPFPNVDGVKFLNHDMGCGGTRMDSDALCGLLAGYITHPNVAGATVLSLGCQHAQASILRDEIAKRDANFDKPLYIFEQQKEGTEAELMQKALKATFAGLAQANLQTRQRATLDKLCIGLECGGSDGFSGISANPALGMVSDIIVSLGGSVILAEFPELCGVEQEMSDRCLNEDIAQRFMYLMKTYNAKAEADGSGFYMNPSPGNIRDGLITDAIKSAGAAKKGGTSPVANVADYPELADKPGLNLLCTPGNDVESTTAEVAAGANVVLFTTGLGTPTGNPIAPVIKISTNTTTYERMPDIIDINCGTIIDGQETIEESAHRILDYVIEVASGQQVPKAVKLGQDDFIPWRRGVSL
ncbi:MULTISPECIES: UxaA family hydrolase [Sphingobacterium]|uniref:Altronate dehydratase n=1 Tax=Sphingobacterium litopenaei TaxID=2763500 RepID=A0ABR7YDG9_9SPHI|nr:MULTISPECIES: altronate dehydratase family protein [Sphingobacterium]MBD1429353.1 altronate dehydratase [Sphingobacterium litopenaei]NGM71934.1 altronate dehydratase [Sphingobacterium sp. SGL-16]